MCWRWGGASACTDSTPIGAIECIGEGIRCSYPPRNSIQAEEIREPALESEWGLNIVIEEYLPRKLKDQATFQP